MALGLGSLGRESSHRAQLAIVHVAGATLGGAIVGGAVGALGLAIGAERHRVWAIAPALALGGYISLRRGPYELGRRCQVPRRWGRQMRPARVLFIWGFLLGSGIATLVPYSAYLVLLAAQLAAGPVLGAVFGGVFGCARELAAVALLAKSASVAETIALLPLLRRSARIANRFASIIGGLILIFVS
jgi:hypothetical protein